MASPPHWWIVHILDFAFRSKELRNVYHMMCRYNGGPYLGNIIIML